MEIPTNKIKDNRKEFFIQRILKDLSRKNCNVSSIYTASDGLTPDLAREIGYMFKEKGYFPKLTFFPFGGLQALHISKFPQTEGRGELL